MQFALLIYHSPEAFAMRKNDYNDPYLGAWRAYYQQEYEANGNQAPYRGRRTAGASPDIPHSARIFDRSVEFDRGCEP
jgi:hypothetical protein